MYAVGFGAIFALNAARIVMPHKLVAHSRKLLGDHNGRRCKSGAAKFPYKLEQVRRKQDAAAFSTLDWNNRKIFMAAGVGQIVAITLEFYGASVANRPARQTIPLTSELLRIADQTVVHSLHQPTLIPVHFSADDTPIFREYSIDPEVAVIKGDRVRSLLLVRILLRGIFSVSFVCRILFPAGRINYSPYPGSRNE